MCLVYIVYRNGSLVLVLVFVFEFEFDTEFPGPLVPPVYKQLLFSPKNVV